MAALVDLKDGLTSFAHELAEASGKAILPFFRTRLAVEDKSTSITRRAPERDRSTAELDPVTAADRAGEAAIRDLIAQRYPDHGVIGEEYGRVAEDAEFVWIIDPIDGTKSFISGHPMWGTLIALVHQNQAVLGLLNQPQLGERYWGNGRAAWSSGPKGTQPLATRAPEDISQARAWVSSSIVRDPAMLPRVEALAARVAMLQYGGDCYSVAMLAEGHIDIVIGYGGFEIYDIAAHIPIVTGAGGVITALDGGDALWSNGMIAAANAGCHAAALEILAGPDGW